MALLCASDSDWQCGPWSWDRRSLGGRTGLGDRVRLLRSGHRRAEVEKAGGAQLVDARQVGEAVQSKMHEEARRRHPEERPAGDGAPALGRTQPASIRVSIV